jgi:hypothetical protein
MMLKPIVRFVPQPLAIILITFLLAEMAFRVCNYFRPSFIFYDPSYNAFRGQPHAPDYDFHLNSKGFKDVEFNTEKEPATTRILGLGDSFAFGVVPYQHNYLTLLEDDLTRRGQKTEVINMGIVRTGPRDYLALLVKEGLELRPDRVLVSFFVGNDFEEREENRKLYTYSHVLSFIRYLIILRRGFQGLVIHGLTTYSDDGPALSGPDFLRVESDRSEIYRKHGPQFERDLSRALGYLIQMKRICDGRHIALTVVIIPDEVQVNRSLQSRVLQMKTAESRAGDFDFTLPNRLLAAKLREAGIDFIDLLDSFANASGRTVLYRPNDTHWNIAGNKLAADLIGSHLLTAPQAGR